MLQNSSASHSRLLYGLLIVLLLMLLYNLGGWGVVETSEARYAEISREMWLTGDWAYPRLLGIQHFHKPPLTYIISAAGMELFGTTAFGARFFLQVSLVLQVWLVYLIGQEMLKSSHMALLAAVIYSAMPVVLLSARNLTTDSFLTTFELAAIFAWCNYRYGARVVWLYLFYLLLALAFLTKGPVGLIFPLLVLSGLFQRQDTASDKVVSWHHVSAFLLFLLLGGSWFLCLMLQDTQFVDYFLFKHTVQRYANPETFGRSKPWWFYLVLAPALSMPWAAVVVWQGKRLIRLPYPLKRLFILWLLVPLLFFSFSGSKLILYILPLFAGLALLTSWLLVSLPHVVLQKVYRGCFLYYVVLAVAFLLSPLVPQVKLVGWPLALPVLMLVGLAAFWLKSGPLIARLILASLWFSLLLLPFSTHLLHQNPAFTNGSRPVAEAIQKRNLQQRPVLVYNRLMPSLAFELNRPIISLDDGSSRLERETQFERNEKWRDSLLELERQEDREKLIKLLKESPVLVVKQVLPEKQRWMLSYFKQQLHVGEWVIYY